MDERQFKQLESVLKKYIEKIIDERLKIFGIEATSSGKVASLDKTRVDSEGTIQKVLRASVELSNGDVVSNLFNASGEILTIGDSVKIFGSKTDMSNRYIGIRYEREVVL
jgi:hypothetical protein